MEIELENSKKSEIEKLFLPSGEVHPEYLKYMFWNSISMIIISAEFFISTHCMLIGTGCTNLHNISINFIGKDIIGQLGSAIISSKIGKKIDDDVRKYVNVSLAIEQASTLLECAVPILPVKYYLIFGSISNAGKNISYSATGAVNAKVINRLSPNSDNIAEIYSKMTAVNTITSSLGMSLGLCITRFIKNPRVLLATIPILSGLRFYTFNKAIESFN